MNVEINKDLTTQIRASARPTKLRSGLETLEKFSADLHNLNEALDDLSLLTGKNASRAVERLKKNLNGFEPSITLLGQVKSGKTSLVNAMAGWADLLPSDVNPWTSVVTSLHLRPGNEPAETGARFKFMTEKDWERLSVKGGRMGEMASRAGAESELQKISEQIEKVRDNARNRLGNKFELLLGQEHEYGYFDKNLLERYICLGDDFEDEFSDPDDKDQGRFADITSSAELFLNCLTFPVNICVKDTPGVNDTFMMREQITVQAIRESRMCVVVLSANQALTSVDLGLIRLISNLKNRDVVIFVNRIDELSDPVAQVPQIEISIRATLKEQGGPEEATIIFGSAHWANKALSGDMEGIHEASQQALFSWAEASLREGSHETEPLDMVWDFSGLPALFRVISERIVEDQGDAFLAKTANSAVTIATSQQAAGLVRITAEDGPALTNVNDAISEFDRLRASHMQALQEALSELIGDYYNRADRAHDKFVERAVQSLITHLEQNGEKVVWEYDPSGLRILLRSGYSVFGSRVLAQASKCYENALVDVAELYSRAFGSAVEGIQISVPAMPEIPAPVSIGQTIALDFNDRWWVSWWQRTRGYQAFAKRFRKLISAETQDFMTQLKSVQTTLVSDGVTSGLDRFFEEQRDILFEIGSGASRQGDIQGLFNNGDDIENREKMDDVLDTLRQWAA